jgi:hypothetical protein
MKAIAQMGQDEADQREVREGDMCEPIMIQDTQSQTFPPPTILYSSRPQAFPPPTILHVRRPTIEELSEAAKPAVLAC